MNRKSRNIRIAVLIAAAYAAIIVSLLAAESGAPGSSIHSIGDAIWYSIITLTTVGYGDLSPVTPAGRLLGIILALCSLGLLTALIGILMSFISGEALPRMKLRSSRSSKWYVFNEENEQSAALAQSVLTDSAGSEVIFLHSAGKLISSRDAVRFACSPGELIALKGELQDILFFCVSEDTWDNYRQASDAAKLGISTYCLTEFGKDDPAGCLHTFSHREIISRCYWRDFPLLRNEKNVVLIGSGSIASELLERGLLTNVFEAGRYINYHVFGDPSEFRKSHPEAVKALGSGSADDDALFFYEGSWKDRPDIIRSADRIIICEDDDKSDLSINKELSKWFPTTATVHVRINADLGQVNTFGSCSSIYTLKSLIRDDINRLAVTLHEIYSESADDPVRWDDLSGHLKRSNITAADHMIVKVRFITGDDSITELTEENCRKAYELFRNADPQLRDVCREMEHRRWMRFHQMYNWIYSPQRDNRMRQHPLMLPYQELSEEDKEKDAYAWEMLGRVADRPAVRRD